MTRGHQQRAVQSEFGRQKQRRAGPTDMGMEICLHLEVAHHLTWKSPVTADCILLTGWLGRFLGMSEVWNPEGWLHLQPGSEGSEHLPKAPYLVGMGF